MIKELKEQRQHTQKKAGLFRALSFVFMFLILSGSLAGIGALLFQNTALDETGRGTADVEVANITGSGTASQPWVITTKADLIAFQANTAYWATGTHARLAADIDWGGSMAGNWIPIGNATTQYRGTFDGMGFVVKNLYIKTTAQYQGFFGYIVNATVRNLGIVDNYFETARASDAAFIGGIAGRGEGTVIITDCFNTGTVKNISAVTNVALDYVAGILGGSNQAITLTIARCFNIGDITGACEVGGIYGYNLNAAGSNISISQCFNAGEIVGNSRSIGGIVGDMRMGTIQDCYNVGNARNLPGCPNRNHTGGISGVGGGAISRSYNTGLITGAGDIGGIDGTRVSGGSVTSSFNNQNRNPSVVGGGSNGTNRTTAQMVADNVLTVTAANGGMSELNTSGAWYKRLNDSSTDSSLQYYPEIKVFAEHPNWAVREYSKASVVASGFIDPGYKPNAPVQYTDPGTIDLGYIGQSDTVINTATISARDINDPIRTFQWVSPSVVSGGSH